MATFTYTKGTARQFIRAPEWATIRARLSSVGGADIWLERREIGARAVVVGFPHDVFVTNKLPAASDGEIIIAVRERVL